MHHLTTNVEEQLIIKAIQDEVTWEDLPKRLKLFMASKDDWHRKIKDYCIKKRLKWNECHARTACKESEYYDDLMRYLRKNLALFPYHLSENICRLMRISPFRYYCDMLYEVMKNEKPYDSIPNFSAADALRLTGIGRNEFIDIMNRSRGKKFLWKMNKSIVKDMLPTVPVDIVVEPWWTVCVVNLSLEEYRKLSPEELVVVDKICKEEINLHCEFDPRIVRDLYRRGLVYFDVLVFPDDRFQVSNLEGFVSNREQSYEDPIEEILYAVFVASSEHATISELATTLQVNLYQLEGAVSVACRLGWATKVLDPASLLNEPGSPASEGDAAAIFTSPGGQSPLHDAAGAEQQRSKSDIRVAFLIDANMTSYLMMGSFSPGLKSHAVTLYEAGKLGDSNIAEFCNDLKSLEDTKLEGELQQFVDHALSLRYALECLRTGGTATDIDDDLEEAGPRVSNGEADSLFQDLESEFSFVNGQGITTSRLSMSSDTGLTGKARGRRKKYRVDVLRCESLASLPSATLQRLFQRDYSFVVSMIPLACPPLGASNSAPGPVHFGSPSPAAITPWMKLLLYTVFESGPVSVVLLRGLRLRLLPPPLSGCTKALVWTWDGSTYAGIGGRLEGTMIPGSVLLHGLNSVLRHSAVLVQPFSEVQDTSLVTVDVPLPLKENSFKNHLKGCSEERIQAFMESAEELCLRTVGYIRFLQVQRATSNEVTSDWVPQAVEFGVPLADTGLCKAVCEGAVSCELFHVFSLPKHQDAMHQLKKMLHDFIGEYHANGVVAKLAYTCDKTEAARPHLTTNFSSRWNPFAEPESPSPRTNPRSRRRHSSMMSFDGDILRAYSLAPVDSAGAARSRADQADDFDITDVPLPGVNLVFDGANLVPLDIGPCLQGRLTPALVAQAAAATLSRK